MYVNFRLSAHNCRQWLTAAAAAAAAGTEAGTAEGAGAVAAAPSDVELISAGATAKEAVDTSDLMNTNLSLILSSKSS